MRSANPFRREAANAAFRGIEMSGVPLDATPIADVAVLPAWASYSISRGDERDARSARAHIDSSSASDALCQSSGIGRSRFFR